MSDGFEDMKRGLQQVYGDWKCHPKPPPLIVSPAMYEWLRSKLDESEVQQECESSTGSASSP